MSSNKKLKKIMGFILVPLSFLVIGYLLIYFIVYPFFRPVYSMYSMVSSQYGPNFNSSVTNLFDGKIKGIEAFEIPARGSIYGKVIIESIGVDLDLYYGDKDTELNYGLGTYPGSSLPGYGKTILVAGHTIPYLKNMGQLRVGDIIKVDTFYAEYEYKVYDIKVGRHDDSSMYDLAQEEKEILEIYTCYPLDGIGFKSERLFVYADKISGPAVIKE